jgi:hypothetical protein
MGSPHPCPCALGASKQGRSGASGRGASSIGTHDPEAQGQGKHGWLVSLYPADAVQFRGEGAVACRARACPHTPEKSDLAASFARGGLGEDKRAGGQGADWRHTDERPTR